MAMTLRLSPEDEQLVEKLAQEDGVSRHEAILRAVREMAARRGHADKVVASSMKARERYADVLKRLGE